MTCKYAWVGGYPYPGDQCVYGKPGSVITATKVDCTTNKVMSGFSCEGTMTDVANMTIDRDNCQGTVECNTICANENNAQRTQVSSCIPLPEAAGVKWQSIKCESGTATRKTFNQTGCSGNAETTESIGDCTETCPSDGVKPKGIVVIGLLASMVMAFCMI